VGRAQRLGWLADLRDQPLAPGSAAALFDRHLFGSDRPSCGAAEHVYDRQTNAVMAYLVNHNAKMVTVNMDSRKADRQLANLLGPVIPADGRAAE
jgi:hypothetical protein